MCAVASLERVVREVTGNDPGTPAQFAELFPEAAALAGVERRDIGQERFLAMVTEAREVKRIRETEGDGTD